MQVKFNADGTVDITGLQIAGEGVPSKTGKTKILATFNTNAIQERKDKPARLVTILGNVLTK